MTQFTDMLLVEYIHHSGVDLTPVNSAKISRGKEGDENREPTEKEIKLMNFLAEHKHMTPFEHQSLTVIVHCPLYIRSQIHRHRTFSYNEVSRRYTNENIEFYVPEDYHKQGIHDKQKSGEKHIKGISNDVMRKIEEHCKRSEDLYHELLEDDIAREEARSVLPVNLMTKFYMTGNLRNWIHFIELRIDNHAQYEVQVIARQVLDVCLKIWPESTKCLMKYMDCDNAEEINKVLGGEKE